MSPKSSEIRTVGGEQDTWRGSTKGHVCGGNAVERYRARRFGGGGG